MIVLTRTGWLPLLGLLGFCASALAQDPAGNEEDSDFRPVLEEVVVTGTRITRRTFTAPSPVSTLERESILATAQPNLEEALNRMPQITPDFGRTSNNPGNGKALVNLRGLGANRTLVMLNGRRLAPAGLSSQVDVNLVPQSLIERVEVVTGGATTVYGSDAVSGVVNLITRTDYDGIELEASAYFTEEWDSEVYDANLSWGHDFDNDSGNISLFAGYLQREAMLAGEREISAVPLLDTWSGEVRADGSPSGPAGLIAALVNLGSGPAPVTFTPEGKPRSFIFPDDLYNFAPLNYLQIPLNREYAGLFVDYDINDRLTAYSELLYTHSEVEQTLAPVPATLRVRVNLTNPVLTPETRQLLSSFFTAPGSNIAQFTMRRRIEEIGARIINNENDYWRLVAGLRGDFFESWTWNTWITYTDNDEQTLRLNDASRSRFLQGLLVDPANGTCFDPSGGCVPVNPFGAGALSSEALEFIRLPGFSNQTKREQALASSYISGEVFDAWAGPVSMAFGLEWRKDSGSLVVDEALFSGDTLGFRGDSSVVGEESVSEVYAEALIPLADGAPWAYSAELEIGGRLSDYRNAGSTDSYKLGGSWEPVDGVRFRAMYQRSVRAPNLVEAFQEQLIEEGSFVMQTVPDPCSASQDPLGTGLADRCKAQGIPANQIGVFEATSFYPTEYVFGGNPELIPETGKTLTIGLVLDRWQDWLFSLDYFDLTIEDTIGEADVALVCFDPGNKAAALCERINRDPVNYNVNRIDGTIANLGKLNTKGFDFQAQYITALPDKLSLGSGLANLSLDLIWTHVDSLSFQDNPAVEPIDCAGTFGFPCSPGNVGAVTPKNRISLFTTYTAGPFDAHLTWRWLQSINSNVALLAALTGFKDPVVSIPTVPSRTYLDLALAYEFNEHLRARLTIANLLDTHPPLMANTVFANNTDTGAYDIFGRSYQFAIYYRF